MTLAFEHYKLVIEQYGNAEQTENLKNMVNNPGEARWQLLEQLVAGKQLGRRPKAESESRKRKRVQQPETPCASSRASASGPSSGSSTYTNLSAYRARSDSASNSICVPGKMCVRMRGACALVECPTSTQNARYGCKTCGLRFCFGCMCKHIQGEGTVKSKISTVIGPDDWEA